MGEDTRSAESVTKWNPQPEHLIHMAWADATDRQTALVPGDTRNRPTRTPFTLEKIEMTKFEIRCVWEVCGTLTVDANNLEEAIKLAEDTEKYGLPDESDYVDGSFQVDRNAQTIWDTTPTPRLP